jgi:hypothetical protein
MTPLRSLAVLSVLFLAAPLAGERLRPLPPVKPSEADIPQFRQSWRVLEPISRGNLSIYPILSKLNADTSAYLTLDEGVASGEVRIAERGQIEPALLRRRDDSRWPRPPQGGASVNELVLINNSARPLILLAGEVVTGGKQNRVIGADVVVPPKSEPLPLSVFCVEHGRWSESRGTFAPAQAIANPEIRRQAQTHKSQRGVWEAVDRVAASAGAAPATRDYSEVLNSAPVRREWDDAAGKIQADYERELREHLRRREVVGVVVAINGRLVWADVFSSSQLFEKYWPRLLRSYVIEAARPHIQGGFGARVMFPVPSAKEAQQFLLADDGAATVHLEPGAFRRTEIAGKDFQLVALEALEGKSEFGLLLHYNKMLRG